MAGSTRPKAKLSRALGMPLTPKCDRYFQQRPYPPGDHGRNRRKSSDYGTRLLEKQRLRHQYNISETQLRRTFAEAQRLPGKTGENLLSILESRLDAVVLRSGFARTIYQARQLVVHQHFLVNGKRVDRPSFRVRPYDIVEVDPRSKTKHPFIVAAAGGWSDGRPPAYLSVDLSQLRAIFVDPPRRELIPVLCEEQLVVEFYAR